MKRRPAEVQWFDAWGTSGYLDTFDDRTAMRHHQIGYIVDETEETLVLAASINENDRYRDINFIPWVNVIKIEEIVYE